MANATRILPLLLLCACPRWTPADDSQPQPDDSQPDTVPYDSDTGPAVDPLQGVVQVTWDDHSLADYGLVVAGYAMNDDHPGGYKNNEGHDAQFYVIARPEAFTDGRARPVLLWLHGGAVGVDGVEEQAGVFCTEKGIASLVENALYHHELLQRSVAVEDWIELAPVNTWCDMWAGLGPDDPVDTNHNGAYHVDWVFRAVEAGLSGLVPDPSRYYSWGTSIGGVGVFPLAVGMPGTTRHFEAIVSDSGPMVLTTWYFADLGQAYCDHILGGPAYDQDGNETAWTDNYRRVDGQMLVRDEGFRVPALIAYNTYDQLTPEIHGDTVGPLMDELYPPAGARYFYHNWNHLGPGMMGHTQTLGLQPPYSQTTMAALRFLKGASLQFVEAEALCPTCLIERETKTSTYHDDIAAFSDGAAVVRAPTDGPGALFSGAIPEAFPRGIPATLYLPIAATLTEECGPKQEFLAIALLQGETTVAQRRISVGEMEWRSADASLANIAATSLSFEEDLDGDGVGDGLPEGELLLDIQYAGCGKAWFDGIWIASTAP